MIRDPTGERPIVVARSGSRSHIEPLIDPDSA